MQTHPLYIRYLYAGLIVAIYILGLLLPLFDNDSAHHALIGMHMHVTGDYVSLIDRGRDYLDKPHMLFWLSALGDMLLGIGTLSYKLPSLLLAIPGIYATFRLAKLLYNERAGWNAVLILVSTQAYILAHNDVRMDALLLSFIITATWLLYEYTVTLKPGMLVAGTVVLAMSFATKGMSGAAVPVIAVGSQLLYTRNWRFIFSFKWIWAIPLFFLFISPVLYCYYLQYDLHPGKVIRGMSRTSGVAFILFHQNTERLNGVNWGSSGGNDPFLFFHSLLWALLPWCLLGYWAVFKRGFELIKNRFLVEMNGEILSWTTIVVMFCILTSSNFRLPHYLNILFPFFVILIAGELEKVKTGSRESKVLNGIQMFVAVVMILLGLVINLYLFPVKNYAILLLAIPALYLVFYEWRATKGWPYRLIGISLSASVLVNVAMNGSFYYELQRYQAGQHIAAKIGVLGLEEHNIYVMNWESPTLNYYSGYFYAEADSAALASRNDFWVAGPIDEIFALQQAGGFQVREAYHYLDFDTTKLKSGFINPKTRLEACKNIGLVHLKRD
ncbi:4-amino-4-deoxy-L-arabinose transferase [Dyadobacter soli]|uniref:4-amino-4-deoxy-L-arabinose transferase n=1 Tax=Dyadobacter soli TaxID=659014 RepID=A0A1G7KZ73_9BACT|nr:glycosyltransferase family 39 protein [Dyadobacter soli]SDF42572.1 4-amino-4-deoxy-L-arabinose transferase [Dyadobacter soli]